jgi:hypothetical protein
MRGWMAGEAIALHAGRCPFEIRKSQSPAPRCKHVVTYSPPTPLNMVRWDADGGA